MRHGFKSGAERLALEVRRDFGWSATDKLDPFKLAEGLAIPVLTIREVARIVGHPTLGSYFLGSGVEELSALTVFDRFRRLIIHNERHSQTRQASNLAHEISHCLLEHEPRALTGPDGHRQWNPEMESEASWLGGALLVPRDGAFELLRSGFSVSQVAQNFSVSENLSQWRINETGVALHLKRLAKYHPSRRRTKSA